MPANTACFTTPHIVFATLRVTVSGSVMAAYGGGFESAGSIEEKRELKRKAREEVLQKVNWGL